MKESRPDPRNVLPKFFFRQEGLGQLASKFGTSPEELLKEEKNWATGVQEVRDIFCIVPLPNASWGQRQWGGLM